MNIIFNMYMYIISYEKEKGWAKRTDGAIVAM